MKKLFTLMLLACSGLFLASCDDNDENNIHPTEPLVEYGYDNPLGTFVLNEGNMTTENGSLIYIAPDGKITDNVYRTANNGAELGNSVQDLFITDGKIYIVSQDGKVEGKPFTPGDGYLVCADLKTMKRIEAYNDELKGLSKPTHVAVIGDKAYIRDNKGINLFDLKTKEVTLIPDSKADKIRMAVVGDKVFASSGESLKVFQNGALVETMKFDGRISGVVKSHDGQLWVSVTSKPAKICKVSTSNLTILQSNSLGDFAISAGWATTPGFCAIGNLLYFSNNSTIIYRHNFETKETEQLVNVQEYVADAKMIYGNPGVHPLTGEVYFTSIEDYGTFLEKNDITVFDFSGKIPVMKHNFKAHTHFPSGIFFTASF